jgi:hypothetical protein
LRRIVFRFTALVENTTLVRDGDTVPHGVNAVQKPMFTSDCIRLASALLRGSRYILRQSPDSACTLKYRYQPVLVTTEVLSLADHTGNPSAICTAAKHDVGKPWNDQLAE